MLAGATGRVGRSTSLPGKIVGGAKSALLGTAVPEAVVAQNHAYKVGQKVFSKAKTAGIDIGKLTKRDVAKARMAAEGRLKEKHQNQLTRNIQNIMKGNTLPKRSIKAGDIKSVMDRPLGNRSPHSAKAVWAGNAATTASEPVAGALNSFKHAVEHPKIANSAIGKRLNKMLVTEPAKKAIKEGREGAKVSKLKDAGYKYLVNGPVGTGLQKLREGAKWTSS